jgi:hypothetical protein
METVIMPLETAKFLYDVEEADPALINININN